MAKLKYYALCCRNMHGTKRHLDYIPKEDLVIVLNSWSGAKGEDGDENAQYLVDAEAWCISESVEYYVTESDGTPSTGKNSVMELFRASDNDYMVLVDGDDQKNIKVRRNTLTLYIYLRSPTEHSCTTISFGRIH